jgi:hypothetical protein
VPAVGGSQLLVNALLGEQLVKTVKYLVHVPASVLLVQPATGLCSNAIITAVAAAVTTMSA